MSVNALSENSPCPRDDRRDGVFARQGDPSLRDMFIQATVD